MIVTPSGIRVISYVHTKDGGLREFDSLTEQEKRKAATELKLRYMNALFRGRATFSVAEGEQA